MQAPTAPRPVHVPGSLDRTQPIPVVHAVVRPARRGLTTSMLIGAVVVTALIATGTIAFVLGTRTATASPTIATPPVSVIAPTSAPAPVAPAEPGPAVTDRSGRPVDPEIAGVVTRVFDALEAGDLVTVRRAYSASGSDDWHTSSPHLRSASERSGVLAALRERPAPHDGYLYSANSYTVQFGQGVSIAGPGLLTIDGPWATETPQPSAETSAESADSGSGASAAPSGGTRSSGCAAGTVATPTEGYPCQDPDTGRGVELDGTVGVHGLKPCPHGTTIPTDPDEPTRNAKTGEVCGYSP